MVRATQPSPPNSACGSIRVGRGGALPANRVLQGCCKGVARVLQGCCKGVLRVLQGCCKGVPKVLQKCFKNITRVLQGCYIFLSGADGMPGGEKDVTEVARVLQGDKGVTRVLPFWGGAGMMLEGEKDRLG
jgi:hypothetical protein